MRVLVVEDDTIIAWDLTNTIIDLGHEIVGEATNADDAVALAVSTKPDLIFMDIFLAQGTNGITAATEIRRLTGKAVVYLTSNSDKDTYHRALTTKPLAYLPKPFDPRMIAEVLEKNLGET